MSLPDPPDRFFRIRNALSAAASTVSQLDHRQYVLLERITRGRDFSASDIRRLLEQLAPWRFGIPDWATSGAEVMQIAIEPETWRVRVPIWREDRRSDVVVTVTLAYRDGSPDDKMLKGINAVPEFRADPRAASVEELALQDAFQRERIEASRRSKAERNAQLRTAPKPDLPSEIAGPLERAMRDLVEGRFDMLEAKPLGPDELSAQDMSDALEEFGGGWVLPPQIVPPGTEIAMFEDDNGDDDPNAYFAECHLWNATGQTDVVVTFELIRPGQDEDFAVSIRNIRKP
jgi:hypothetical protein